MSEPIKIEEFPLPQKGRFVPKLEPFQFLTKDKHALHVDWQNFNYRLKKFRLPCKVEDNLPLLPSDGDAFINEEYIDGWPDVFANLEVDREYLQEEAGKSTIRGLICQMETDEFEEQKEREYFEQQDLDFHFKDTIFHMQQTYEDYKGIPEKVEVWDEETLEDMILADEAEMAEKEVHLPKYLKRDLFADVKHLRYLDPKYIEETIIKSMRLNVDIKPLDELLKEGLKRVEIVPPDVFGKKFDVREELDKMLKVENPLIPEPLEIDNIFDETDEEYMLDLVLDCCFRAVWQSEQMRTEEKDDTIDEIVDKYLDQIEEEEIIECLDETQNDFHEIDNRVVIVNETVIESEGEDDKSTEKSDVIENQKDITSENVIDDKIKTVDETVIENEDEDEQPTETLDKVDNETVIENKEEAEKPENSNEINEDLTLL